jgi:hypothetical protein
MRSPLMLTCNINWRLQQKEFIPNFIFVNILNTNTRTFHLKYIAHIVLSGDRSTKEVSKIHHFEVWQY